MLFHYLLFVTLNKGYNLGYNHMDRLVVIWAHGYRTYLATCVLVC